MSLDDVDARIRDAGGQELVDRLRTLESVIRADPPMVREIKTPAAQSHCDYDVIFAGGGLSTLIAPLLAEKGLRVAVFEQHRTGTSQREWNASGPELEPLFSSGLFSHDERSRLIVAKYDHGICRWHEGGSYPVVGALDHAVDATWLLQQTRLRAQRRGVEFFDEHRVTGHSIGSGAVAVEVLDRRQHTQKLCTRVMVDARGAASPYAKADLICPTVGGVLSGLQHGDADDEVNARVGDILATTEHVEDGQQHIWEAFPGRSNETTIYLFYYTRRQDLAPGALRSLYARFFLRRPMYKRGDATLLRPTFGYIPGWSRLSPAPSPPTSKIYLVGDAAARQSPLTYCGFGQMLRSFVADAEAIAALAAGAVPTRQADRSIHAGTGALSMMMAKPPRSIAHASALNNLLDAAFASLYEMGNQAYLDLLRDEMQPSEFVAFLYRAAKRRPRIYQEVFAQLGPVLLGCWALQLMRARFGVAA